MRGSIFLMVGLLGCAHASAPAAAGTTKPELPAHLTPEQVVQLDLPASLHLAAGSDTQITLTLRIAAGYHVMSDHPSNKLYIPTRVSFASAPPLSWGTATYPAPRDFRLLDETITTFEGEVHVQVPLHPASDAAPGTYESKGTLAYQSCTAASCLFPVRRAFTVRVEIAHE